MHPIFGCFFAPCFCKRATPNASTFVVAPAYHGRHSVAPIVFFTFMNYSKGLNRTSFTLVLRPSASLYHVLPTFAWRCSFFFSLSICIFQSLLLSFSFSPFLHFVFMNLEEEKLRRRRTASFYSRGIHYVPRPAGEVYSCFIMQSTTLTLL